ncbi:ABC transporter permease [Mangrovitalea sediminis]|uniref:ABC transporter permease n=1 Tax=Mangrovitalea sediminis TaxID=1982043 RepID=UPI001D0D6604|nr:FtsX-like permease family protein [Mangrovitalea sediminis]
MKFLHLLLWLGRRDWALREVRVTLLAVLVAVATVATIGLFADQLQRSVMASGSQFLAADRQLRGSQPMAEDWLKDSATLGLRHAAMVRFSSMLFADQHLQLASVKAVGSAYPLAGQVTVRDTPSGPVRRLAHGPAPGKLWVDARLLPLLHINVGDSVQVGQASFKVAAILVQEPDAGLSMLGLAPRVLMNLDDVAATGVIQPGSRVAYVDFFSGSDPQLSRFHDWLKTRLRPDQRWIGVKEGRPAVSRTIDRAERFLMLGGSLAVLMALVAIAVASRQYAIRQLDTVALLKTFGLTQARINRLYLGRLASWTLIGTGGGLLLALPLWFALAQLAKRWITTPLAWSLNPVALWPAAVTAVVALFAFALPPIVRLRKVPAMRVLRSLPGVDLVGIVPDVTLALLAMVALIALYARNLWLVAALLGGLAALLLLLVLIGWGLANLLSRVGQGGGTWRLALIGMRRHRRALLSQVAVVGLTMMLVGTLYLVRTSLLQSWQRQLPAEAPNEFLVNIAPDAVPQVRRFLDQNNLSASHLYPMVRGRLTEINGKPVRQVVSDANEVEALNRELNLTWMEKLPADNKLVEGRWWRTGITDEVSVEQRLAEKLGLHPGDRVTFVIGAQQLTATVASIRSVDWESMRPNFYVAFPPGALADYPATWITSFYLPHAQRLLLDRFNREFPTITVLDIAHLINRIHDIVGQITQAVEALLVMILAAALLVVIAVLGATLPERQREGALLRTLGARRATLVRSTLLEFALIGAMAGLAGVAAAEGAVWLLQYRLFSGTFEWHLGLWLVLPVLSALLMAVVGRLQLKPVLTVSPMLLLRQLE